MNLQLWKQRKKELRLTLQKISDLSGIPKRTVADIFCGSTTNPRINTVEAIERVLGLGETVEPLEETLITTDEASTFEVIIKILIRGADNGR